MLTDFAQPRLHVGAVPKSRLPTSGFGYVIQSFDPTAALRLPPNSLPFCAYVPNFMVSRLHYLSLFDPSQS